MSNEQNTREIERLLEQREEIDGKLIELFAEAPTRWTFYAGGGHAYNSIRTNNHFNCYVGSYTDRVCENLGDPALPDVQANIALILAAPLQAARIAELEAQVAALLEHAEAMAEALGAKRVSSYAASYTDKDEAILAAYRKWKEGQDEL